MTPTSPQHRETPSVIARLFAIDVRALAILRIAVGLLVLGELFNAIGTFSFFYGGNGFLTIPLNQVFCPTDQGFWSLYWLIETPWFVATLMVLTAVAALGLACGWRTREMTIIVLVLFWSLNVRNPLVTTAGHVLLRMVLFWMMFLPMGAVWSIDARLKNSKVENSETKVCSVATAALMIQIAMMYFFSGIAKWNDVWMRGDALEIALHLDLYVKPLGHWLAQFPMLTKSITLLTVVMELIGPFLIFLPFGNRWWRIFFLVTFCSMHFGIWLTMSIGIFSIAAICCWVVFLPSEFWNRFGQQQQTDNANNSIPRRLPLWASAVCALFLVLSIAMNVGNAGVFPKANKIFRTIGNVTMTTQEFVMFGRPSPDNIWFELRQGDGKNWETVRGPNRTVEDVTDPDSRSIYLTENSQYWRRTLFNLSAIKTENIEQQKWLLQVRQHLAKCWLADARRGQTEAPLGNIVQLNCWRRTIDLNARQPARREQWAEFDLTKSQ